MVNKIFYAPGFCINGFVLIWCILEYFDITVTTLTLDQGFYWVALTALYFLAEIRANKTNNRWWLWLGAPGIILFGYYFVVTLFTLLGIPITFVAIKIIIFTELALGLYLFGLYLTKRNRAIPTGPDPQ